MLGCFRKSCKTKSASPRRKTPSPHKSPAREKWVGSTKMNGTNVYSKNGKLGTRGGNVVKYVVNRQFPQFTGYYTAAEFKRLAALPVWNF